MRPLNNIVLLAGLVVFWGIVFAILSGPVASLIVLLMENHT
jgi:hypothetical protein